MDDLVPTSDALNGAGQPAPAPASQEHLSCEPLPPPSLHFDNICCKCGAPLSLTLQHLESRIATLEDAKARLENAFRNFGKSNPMSKIMMAALPKEAQRKLAEFFNGSDGK